MSKQLREMEAGQGFMEYALVLILVSVAGVIVLSVFGSQIRGYYSNIMTMFNIDTGEEVINNEDDLSASGCQQGNGSSWVTGFDLVDAENDVIVGPISDGATVNLGSYGAINVIAKTGGNTVRVNFSGTFNATENSDPYSVGGNSGGDFYALGASPGQAVIRATPQDSSNTDGTACEITITFA